MKRAFQFVFNTIVPILVLAMAVMGFKALVAGRVAPDRERPPDRGMLVQVDVATQAREPITVSADGVVVPARQLVVRWHRQCRRAIGSRRRP